MLVGIRTLLVILGSFAASAAEPLLVLVDETLREPLAEPLAAWTAQIAAEGRYSPMIEVVPRSGDEAGRLANLALMRSRIEAVRPAAVQLVGHLDWGISGWKNPDGHEFRAVCSDAHLMDATFAPTDVLDFGSTGLRPNLAGDGRWDQQSLNRFTRPVARIDLGGMPGSMTTSPAYQFQVGCLKGQPFCPAVPEVPALRDYFRRNLEYRTGAWRPPRVAYMVGPLWDTTLPGLTMSRMSQFDWIRSGTSSVAAGQDAMLLWSNCAATELDQLRREPDCVMPRVVWSNTYRSYGMEVLDPCGTLRGWLQWSLVSTWGGFWWTVSPAAQTVADAIRGTAADQTAGWELLYQVMGDLTLPLDVPPVAPSVVDGLVTRITLRTSGGTNAVLPTAEITSLPAARLEVVAPAVAEAQVTNGLVAAIKVVDGGAGYAEPPAVELSGGGGSGARAEATVRDGVVDSVRIVDAGDGYLTAPAVLIGRPAGSTETVPVVGRVVVQLRLMLGDSYLLESSPDLLNWSPVVSLFRVDREEVEQELVLARGGCYFRVKQVL